MESDDAAGIVSKEKITPTATAAAGGGNAWWQRPMARSLDYRCRGSRKKS
jgi:hypothetical protein